MFPIATVSSSPQCPRPAPIPCGRPCASNWATGMSSRWGCSSTSVSRGRIWRRSSTATCPCDSCVPSLAKTPSLGYFKFAFVRNPFDRFVSYCAFMLRGGDAFRQRPREVMRHFLFGDPPEHHILFQPQASLLLDENGKTLLTDMVGRVEDMQASYDAICARIGIASRPLERVNGSRHGDYHQYYDQALIDGVAARYASRSGIVRIHIRRHAMNAVPVGARRQSAQDHDRPQARPGRHCRTCARPCWRSPRTSGTRRTPASRTSSRCWTTPAISFSASSTAPATGAGPMIATLGRNGAPCWSRCWLRPSAVMVMPAACFRG